VTVGSDVRPAGTVLVPAPEHARDPQASLLVELVSFMTRDIASVDHLVALVLDHLRGLGLESVTVFTLEPDDGTLTRLAGPPHTREDMKLAGKVFRVPAGGPPVSDGTRLAVRLRVGGQTVGVLLLTGLPAGVLRPDVLGALALHFATTLQSLTAERQRQFITHATATIRKLFEEGTVATSVEAAGRLLAKATAEAFRTEHAAMHLVDLEGRIVHAFSAGSSSDLEDALARNLVGRVAGDSPVWRNAVNSGTPLLVGDASATPVRGGGFVETMGLRSYIAMPLMSAHGPVGMVMCGDSRTREWSTHDRVLAGQLAVEGALIVDSARMRQAEQAHMAELTRQAFHDALTGLPNRSHLMDKAEQATEVAGAAGTRMALLLLDLNGFKQVNDTCGHHVGDALLHAVGRRLVGTLRADDLVARLGGDEFAILLTRDPDEHRAHAIAERLHERLRDPYEIEGRRVDVGASIGVAVFPDHGEDVASLMRGADAAMYRAKRRGGGVDTAE
jgi:diguanylate cyclase (GGDEF)-like protein